MTTKTTKRIYWTGVALTAFWFAASGFGELTRNPAVWEISIKLGYTAYFLTILAVFKLSGVIVLLVPDKLLRLKEWVFAGLLFDISFAFLSKIIVLGPGAAIDAIIAFIMVGVTYAMFRKLYPANYTIAPSEKSFQLHSRATL